MTSISGTARATECRVRAGPHRAQRERASTRRSARARVPPSDRESTSRPRERGCGALGHCVTTPMTTSAFPGTNSERFVRESRRDYPLRAEAIAKRGSHTTTMFGNLFGGSGSKAAAKPRSPRPVRVPRALVGVIAARGTTFRARSARFVPRHGRSRAFSRDAATRPSCRPDTALTPSSPSPNASGKCPCPDCSCGVGCKCGAACKCGSKRR